MAEVKNIGKCYPMTKRKIVLYFLLSFFKDLMKFQFKPFFDAIANYLNEQNLDKLKYNQHFEGKYICKAAHVVYHDKETQANEHDVWSMDTRYITNVTDVLFNVMLPMEQDSMQPCCSFWVKHLPCHVGFLEPGTFDVNEQEYEYGVLHYQRAPCTETIHGPGYHLMIQLKKVPLSFFEAIVPLVPMHTFVPNDILQSVASFFDLQSAYLFMQSSKRMHDLVRGNSAYWFLQFEHMKLAYQSQTKPQIYDPSVNWYENCKLHNFAEPYATCLVCQYGNNF